MRDVSDVRALQTGGIPSSCWTNAQDHRVLLLEPCHNVVTPFGALCQGTPCVRTLTAFCTAVGLTFACGFGPSTITNYCQQLWLHPCALHDAGSLGIELVGGGLTIGTIFFNITRLKQVTSSHSYSTMSYDVTPTQKALRGLKRMYLSGRDPRVPPWYQFEGPHPLQSDANPENIRNTYIFFVDPTEKGKKKWIVLQEQLKIPYGRDEDLPSICPGA